MTSDDVPLWYVVAVAILLGVFLLLVGIPLIIVAPLTAGGVLGLLAGWRVWNVR